jgi:hypothetical protein
MQLPPTSYFLGDQKYLEARIKIKNEVDLIACLDKIVRWKIGELVPEFFFHYGGKSSPTSSPNKWPKKSTQSLSSKSKRTGQSAFHEQVLRRDMNECMFCNSSENIVAAHLIAFKEGVYIDCKISGLQDPTNGIALCEMCHKQFDGHFVGVNPDTLQLEVSDALLHSQDPKVMEKWNLINQKVISAKSVQGFFPSTETFRVKYNVYLKGCEDRRANRSAKEVQCEKCPMSLKNKKALEN